MLHIVRLLAIGLLLAAGGASAAWAAPAEWLLYLKDGRVLRGEIVDRDAERLTVVVAKTGERITFEEALLRKVDGPPLPPRCEAGDGRALAVTLKDGRVLTGALSRRCEGGFTLAVEGAEPIQVRDDEVRSVGAPGGPEGGTQAGAAPASPTALPPAPRPPPTPWRADVARGRLLSSRTALGPARGELLLLTAEQQVGVEAGLTSWLSVAAATTPRVAYGETLGPNATLSLAAAGSWRLVHGRIGVTGAFAGARATTAFLFGSLSVGGPDLQVSLYGGPPLPGAALTGKFGDRILGVGGVWRFNSWAAVLTEHWLAFEGGGDSAHALAGRIMREPLALDVGAVITTGEGRVLPWIGLSWRLWRPE